MLIDAQKLGAKIKHLRALKGWSQEDLARVADLKLSNLAKLESFKSATRAKSSCDHPFRARRCLILAPNF